MNLDAIQGRPDSPRTVDHQPHTIYNYRQGNVRRRKQMGQRYTLNKARITKSSQFPCLAFPHLRHSRLHISLVVSRHVELNSLKPSFIQASLPMYVHMFCDGLRKNTLPYMYPILHADVCFWLYSYSIHPESTLTILPSNSLFYNLSA